MQWIDARCPACTGRGLQRFYTVSDVPVNSCLTVASEADGRAYPRGDLHIALCERCGFITNTAFDGRRTVYDPTYEETQTFSPTFVAFQDALIERLLERYDLRGKTVVEIGCGKGTFLARLAELGDVRGIGIDPTAVPERLAGKAARLVRFVNEFYGPQHASFRPDLLVCRHALEHIPDIAAFLATVRAAVGATPVPIFFELPETLRVLRESAYWDLYFEHCSYFTPGSLARAFERSGFDVTDVRLEYGEQYLLLEARVASGAPTRSATLDQPRDVLREVHAFERRVGSLRRAWRDYFDDVARTGRRIAIWGSGSKCVAFMTTLGLDREVAFVTDVNPYRHGRFIVGNGKTIVAPEQLSEVPLDDVIVMNPIYRDEVATRCRELGIAARILTADGPAGIPTVCGDTGERFNDATIGVG